jgi:hypothetical protein
VKLFLLLRGERLLDDEVDAVFSEHAGQRQENFLVDPVETLLQYINTSITVTILWCYNTGVLKFECSAKILHYQFFLIYEFKWGVRAKCNNEKNKYIGIIITIKQYTLIYM